MADFTSRVVQALQVFAQRQRGIQPFDQTTTRIVHMDYTYEPESAFPVDRFEQAEEQGVLYRPAIVAEMKNSLLAGHQRKGLFVRGPHGIGKSHSLVNLVRTLRAEGHIVTFFPTCENFLGTSDFFDALIRSIGSSKDDIGITYPQMTSDTLIAIIECIERTLPTINKQWFFVFDQVNRLFARPDYQTARDVGVLPLPFTLLKLLNNRRGMKTVISASANNTLAYRENHPGFLEYDHPTTMSREEIIRWKPNLGGVSNQTLLHLEEVTGLCPLQVSDYMTYRDPLQYSQYGVQSISMAIGRFMSETKSDMDKESIVNAAVHSLLSLPLPEYEVGTYDRKYSVLRNDRVQPLFPLVLVAYHRTFWDQMMQYVKDNEAYILQVCGNADVTNDVRGRLFELIVIVRFRDATVVSTSPVNDVLPATVDTGMLFQSQELPPPQSMQKRTLFIPKNPNFPAIDLILKSGDGRDVWALQVHVANHPDVFPTFRTMCEKQGWFEAFDNIYLVYLSPSETVKNLLTCLPSPPERRSKRQRLSSQTNPIQVSAATIAEFECLKNIQWTAPLTDDEEPTGIMDTAEDSK